MKIKKFLIKLVWIIVSVLVIIGFSAMMINNYVVKTSKDSIVKEAEDTDFSLTKEESKALEKLDAQCIIVLGAGIKDRETPSEILKTRLDTGIKLYKDGYAPKLLLSGDNGTKYHNEIHVMLNYAISQGVPSEDIFCDHAGFNTSASMYRAKKTFGVKRAIIVTQNYHEYRAIYIGDKLGIKVLGVSAEQRSFKNQWLREIREVVARNKDFIKILAKQDTSVGGKTFDISGDGTITHGE